MFGKIEREGINKMGFPYVIIRGENGVTLYCDERGMKEGKVKNLAVGMQVQYTRTIVKKGKLVALGVKYIESSVLENGLSNEENLTNCEQGLAVTADSGKWETKHQLYEGEFHQFIENEDYDGALRSQLMTAIPPSHLSPMCMEKAIFAAYKLVGLDHTYTLSEFDKKLIVMDKIMFFLKKDEQIMKEGQEECLERCTPKEFKNLFNNFCKKVTHNTTYLDLAIRFQEACNPLYLPFYVIAAYTSGDSRVFSKYLEYVDRTHYFEAFNAVNKVMQNTVCLNQEIPTSNVSLILGICLDVDRFDLFVDFCSEILHEIPDFVTWIEQDEIKHDELLHLLSSNLKQSSEKYINYYIYKKLNDETLNTELLRLLSAIAYYYPTSCLQEIMFDNNYARFNKNYKRSLLINNLTKIIDYAKVDPKGYILACFVVEFFMGEAVDITEEYTAFSKDLVNRIGRELKEEPTRIYDVYSLFKLDANGRNVIEDYFCEHIDATYPKRMPIEDVTAFVRELNANHCYFATVYFIETRDNCDDLLTNEELSAEYWQALKNSSYYAKAIKRAKYLNNTAENRDKEILKILYSNFQEHGVSAKAYEVFDDTFTMDYAEELAIKYFLETASPIILMAIYKSKKDIVKIMYLYAIYYDLTKSGNRVFYRQLHRIDARISSVNSHYKVFRAAFTTYDYQGIKDFLNWTSKIVINGRYQKQHDVCDEEINRLIKNPAAKQNWDAIIKKLSKDNVRQINSAFGYAVQCVYLLWFYDLHNETNRQAVESCVDQLTRFASFSKVSETDNFISLNIKMIDAMPETYAIKLAEFFERNSSIFAGNTEINNREIEEFYVRLLKKYNETFEEAYLNLAVKCYSVFSSRITTPHLEQYKSFCRSANDKSVLFKMLFQMYSPDNVVDFHEFVYYDDWNCTGEEVRALDLLRIVYSLDDDEIPNNIAVLPSRLLESFKTDVSMMLQNYPRLGKYHTLMEKDETVGYKYLVLQYAMQIAFDQKIYWDTRAEYWDICDKKGVWQALQNDSIDGVGAVLGFLKVSYAQQSKTEQAFGIEYIGRRYSNMYLIDLYEATIAGSTDTVIDDGYIVELMRENNHESLVYNKMYAVYKTLLSELCACDLSMDTKKALLLSTIRGSLCPIVDEEHAFSELLQHQEALSNSKQLWELSGYPSIAQSALYLYFNGIKAKEVLAFCEVTLPAVYRTITAYHDLPSEEARCNIKSLVDMACAEINHKRFFLGIIGNKPKALNKAHYQIQKNVVINLVMAVVFNYNILRDFGNVVRQGKIAFSDEFAKDLLTQMNEEPVYWYLRAIQYAMTNKKKDATRAFYKAGEKTNIPKNWESEYDDLERYINGEIAQFKTFGIYNDFSTQKETAIRKTILIDLAQSSVNENVNQEHARSAMNVFVNKESTPQEKLNAGSIILSFVKNDALQFVQYISTPSNDESEEKITYNEFVFEYGLLAIKSRKTLFNNKVDIIIELFKHFEFLNDVNKRRFEESLKNTFVNLFATEKPKDDMMAYEQWIESYDDFNEVVNKHHICIEGYDVFATIFKKCADFEKTSYTVMKKIRFLKSLLDGISVKPITKNFLNSVKNELEKLQNGVMANLSILNNEIEADMVFVLLKNMPESKRAINLDPDAGATKFLVTVRNTRTHGESVELEVFCSGDTKIIRPGQVSAERIILPGTSTWEDGDAVEITVVLDVNGEKICDAQDKNNSDPPSTSQVLIYRKAPDGAGIRPATFTYKTKTAAFTETTKGFGRTSDKEWLDTHIPAKNLSVIYGPSRAGKTSLLQYIKNYLAVDYKHKKGVFKSSTKNIDTLYVVSHAQEYRRLPEKDEDRLGFLFLEPIKTMFEQILVDEKVSPDNDEHNIPQDAVKQILTHIEKDLPLYEVLNTISRELTKHNAEIWVMIDEFQQVLAKWPVTQSELFKDFCKRLDESGGRIRYILCGADELVKLMLNQDSVFMYNDNTRPIGQFDAGDKEDYFAMLCDPGVWGNVEHPFTKEALDYIFSFTGGNALYGKMIGNTIIEAIKSGTFANRRKIYPYDVSFVITKMLSKQNDLHGIEVINEVIENVTKNLEAERPYLSYIAFLMTKEPDRTGVTSSEIYEYFGAVAENEKKREINTALRLCCVRGILNSRPENGELVYGFSTTFYFSQCCEMVNRHGVPQKVEITNCANSDGTDAKQNGSFDSLRHSFSRIAKKDKGPALHMLYGCLKDDEQASFRKSYGHNYVTNIETQNNNYFEIQIQAINSAVSTLFSGASVSERLAAFNTLPKADAFYTKEERQRMEELQAALPIVSDDDNENIRELTDDDAATIHEIEEINAKAQNRFCGNVVTTMFKQADEAPNTSLFAEPTDEELKSLLRIKKNSQLISIKALPKEYYSQLCFAIALHKLILPKENEKANYDNVDFSPISIMYCKLIEIMLKENHLELYGKALSDRAIASGETFAALNKPKLLRKKWKDITIGTFVWHLIFQDVRITSKEVKNKSHFESYSSNGVGKTPNIQSLCKSTQKDEEDWKQHALALAEVTEIRNWSAHGGRAVTKPVFDRLLDVLFTDGDGEMLRILELYQKKKNTNTEHPRG